MTETLQTTLEKLKACTFCAEHLPLGAKPIFQINTKAKILLASQAPGHLAHQGGKPFFDPSGVRLRRWLGVNEVEFYNPDNFLIMPIGFCYPGTKNRYDLPPRPECAPIWRDKLLNLLPNIELILAIGSHAQQWHLKEHRYKTMAQTIEHWQEYWPHILPMPHPSPRNNIWFKRHPFFESEVVPILQKRIRQLIDLSIKLP